LEMFNETVKFKMVSKMLKEKINFCDFFCFLFFCFCFLFFYFAGKSWFSDFDVI